MWTEDIRNLKCQQEVTLSVGSVGRVVRDIEAVIKFSGELRGALLT